MIMVEDVMSSYLLSVSSEQTYKCFFKADYMIANRQDLIPLFLQLEIDAPVEGTVAITHLHGLSLYNSSDEKYLPMVPATNAFIKTEHKATHFHGNVPYDTPGIFLMGFMPQKWSNKVWCYRHLRNVLTNTFIETNNLSPFLTEMRYFYYDAKQQSKMWKARAEISE